MLDAALISLVARAVASTRLAVQRRASGSDQPVSQYQVGQFTFAGPPDPEAPRIPTVVSTQIMPGERTEEFIGTERREVNNSQSSSSSVRKLRARRTWIRKSEILTDRSIKVIGEFSGGFPQVVELKATLEGELRKQRSESEQEERSFEEEIEVTVQPRSRVEVLLHWKMVWSNSSIEVKLSDGTSYRIPARESAGLTFDQENRDL